MEESGSEGLDNLIMQEASGFLADVDAVCISDNYWLGMGVFLGGETDGARRSCRWDGP
jgi:hypothetical protein